MTYYAALVYAEILIDRGQRRNQGKGYRGWSPSLSQVRVKKTI